MITKAQESITLYLTQMGFDPDTTYLRYDGEGAVTVETPEGSQKLTINPYEDIVELRPDGSSVVIAVSDLPHRGAGRKRAMATSWTQKEGEIV